MADLVLECESCHGKRFKQEVLDVRFQGKNVHDILEMTINEAIEFFTLHKQMAVVKKLRPSRMSDWGISNSDSRAPPSLAAKTSA